MKECEVRRKGWDGGAHLAATHTEVTGNTSRMNDTSAREAVGGEGAGKAVGRG